MQSRTSPLTLSSIRTSILLLVLLLIPLYGEAMSDGILGGIRLCVRSIIPAVFPFMVLSSMMIGYGVFDQVKLLSRPFERIFHISKNGLCAYLCGIFCGFPLGAKCAAEALDHGQISKEECERLIIFSACPSPAFIICGIGGLYASIKKGVLLYLITLICGAFIGIFLGRDQRASNRKEAPSTPYFSFTEAVERAGLNTLYICSYLLLFSGIMAILRAALSSSLLLSCILPFLEIGAASAFLTAAEIPSVLSFALCAFAASFGGFSVHLQCAHAVRGTGISMKKFCFYKLIQGMIAFTLAFLIGFWV